MTPYDFLPMPSWFLLTVFTLKYIDIFIGIVPFSYFLSSIFRTYGWHLYSILARDFAKKTISKIELMDEKNLVSLHFLETTGFILADPAEIKITDIRSQFYEIDELKGAYYLIELEFRDFETGVWINDMHLLINRERTYIDNIDLFKTILQGSPEEIKKYFYVPQRKDFNDPLEIPSLYRFNFYEELKPKGKESTI